MESKLDEFLDVDKKKKSLEDQLNSITDDLLGCTNEHDQIFSLIKNYSQQLVFCCGAIKADPFNQKKYATYLDRPNERIMNLEKQLSQEVPINKLGSWPKIKKNLDTKNSSPELISTRGKQKLIELEKKIEALQSFVTFRKKEYQRYASKKDGLMTQLENELNNLEKLELNLQKNFGEQYKADISAVKNDVMYLREQLKSAFLGCISKEQPKKIIKETFKNYQLNDPLKEIKIPLEEQAKSIVTKFFNTSKQLNPNLKLLKSDIAQNNISYTEAYARIEPYLSEKDRESINSYKEIMLAEIAELREELIQLKANHKTITHAPEMVSAIRQFENKLKGKEGFPDLSQFFELSSKINSIQTHALKTKKRDPAVQKVYDRVPLLHYSVCDISQNLAKNRLQELQNLIEKNRQQEFEDAEEALKEKNKIPDILLMEQKVNYFRAHLEYIIKKHPTISHAKKMQKSLMDFDNKTKNKKSDGTTKPFSVEAFYELKSTIDSIRNDALKSSRKNKEVQSFYNRTWLDYNVLNQIEAACIAAKKGTLDPIVAFNKSVRLAKKTISDPILTASFFSPPQKSPTSKEKGFGLLKIIEHAQIDQPLPPEIVSSLNEGTEVFGNTNNFLKS